MNSRGETTWTSLKRMSAFDESCWIVSTQYFTTACVSEEQALIIHVVHSVYGGLQIAFSSAEILVCLDDFVLCRIYVNSRFSLVSLTAQYVHVAQMLCLLCHCISRI